MLYQSSYDNLIKEDFNHNRQIRLDSLCLNFSNQSRVHIGMNKVQNFIRISNIGALSK